MRAGLTIAAGALWAAALWLAGAAPAAQGGTVEQARAAFADDVHAAAGLTCESCHRPAGREPAYAAPARTGIPKLCGTCHADTAYMRGFNPQLRTDQLARYVTSTHGRRLAAGDAKVAVCSDCHGAHGVRPVKDPRAPVAPVHVADTCATCHGDAALMGTYGRDAAPVAEWRESVHARALLERGDTSAPTCSTCHGSHGAAPPDVEHVSFVCAQCHVREADLFRKSPKKALFDLMGQAECAACHSNHKIEHPRDEWVGFEAGTVCGTCHDETTGGAEFITRARTALGDVAAAIAHADERLRSAEEAGMIVEDGRAALREAVEQRVHARVMLHGFTLAPFVEPAEKGLAAAGVAVAEGDRAHEEIAYRRTGLAVATVFIVGFLITLGIKIRRLGAEHEAE